MRSLQLEDNYITTSRRFKCVPTFRGSLSIHIFMLLFRFIAESSVFSSDFTRESKTAIEIGAPFEEMCETFLLFSAEKNSSFNSNHCPLNFLTTNQGTPNLEGMYKVKLCCVC